MAPDPKPRRRGHRPRRGVEPAGLRRWRLSRKHKADPRPTRHKPAYVGSRGGRYWQGPTKKRYDPAPRFHRARQYFAKHPRYGRIGGKIEGGLAKWGMPIGFGLAMLFGVKTGLDTYNTAYGDKGSDYYVKNITGGWAEEDANYGKPAEISLLWTNHPADGTGMTPSRYLNYKFLGKSFEGKQVASAWVVPFWAGLIAWITGFVAKRSGIHSAARIGRVIEPMGKGALIAGTIGALALPGCPDAQGREQAFPKLATNARTIQYTYQG